MVIGEDVTEVLDIIPAEVYVKRYVRRTYARPNGEGIVMGELPDRVIDKGIPSEAVIAPDDGRQIRVWPTTTPTDCKVPKIGHQHTRLYSIGLALLTKSGSYLEPSFRYYMFAFGTFVPYNFIPKIYLFYESFRWKSSCCHRR